ncbi:protein DDC8 homolog [Mesocricetus auratus]|uniref:Protein DDC8 homolog n=1 Tax=Mesocricetus auratus TaxID=10036 RepID=A0ABM2XTP5_MESAU|nr:protein DDC8 homolog [Mesocricetus auratus]XP_040606066.1 protein DDC8 homolog [Mesocricetus auratus]XP_040606067.1 protein DDC8 homolog [Mesocricetus auratus]
MQRDVEWSAQLSPFSDEEALVLRQKPELLQVRDKGDVTLQQWKAQQLQRLAEELKAEWQEARLQQVRDMERLYLAHLLDEATGQTMGSGFNEPNKRGSVKHMRAKERSRAAFRAFREEKGRRLREERPRKQPKSRKKATKCSERRGSTKARGPNPSEKGKGKRVPSSKSSAGYQPRVSRGADPGAKLNPLLAGAGETDWVEEIQKEIPREGRRPMRRGTSRFSQILNQSSRDQSPQGETADLEKPLPPSPTLRQEATSQGAPCKYSGKNQWHRDIESAFEELFNTNRKLKKHLNLHLEQRLKGDHNPEEPQSSSETQGEGSDTLREESVEEAGTTAEEPGSLLDMEAPEMWSKTNLKQLLSKAEYPRYQQQMAKHLLTSESLPPLPEAGASGKQDSPSSESPEPGQEPPKSAAVEEESLIKPYLEKQAGSVASWMALRQKQKAELEQRRQKTLLELTEHPNMSLEIHYKAELEEERRARRRMRLAILKSYPSGVQVPVPEKTTPLDSSLLDEDKQSQMIRDLQQQILEQNKLHKQFLEKARKRLQEFQKTF